VRRNSAGNWRELQKRAAREGAPLDALFLDAGGKWVLSSDLPRDQEIFPLLTLNQLRSAGTEQQRTLAAEIGRETATIIMLAAVGLAVAQNAGQWAAAFVITFGTWDITFYIS
jgi:hypothetical protein